jgi:hypothetical protein
MDKFVPYENIGASTDAHVRVKAEGLRPLLTHNPQSLGQKKIAKKGSNVPSPEDEAEAGVYRLEDGSCAIKANSFIAGMLLAGSSWKVKGRTTMRSLLTHVTVVEDLVQLVDPRDGTPLRNYEIDSRPVRVQRARVIRSRPMFRFWGCEFTLEYDRQIIDEPIRMIDVLADAGKRMGAGDHRGQFGTYKIIGYCIL